MIQQLPVEIIDHIASVLDQNDALALAYSSSTLFHAVQPRLYRSICVDALPRIPAASTDTPHEKDRVAVNGTVPVIVRSLYALNRLLQKLEASERMCRELETLVFCQRIPDLHESQFLQSLTYILPHCHRLSVFHWLCTSFDFPLHKLDAHNHWRQVCGNFDVLGLDKPITWQNLTTLDVSNIGSLGQMKLFDLGACVQLEHLTLGQNSILGSLSFDPNAPTLISELASGFSGHMPLTLLSLALHDMQLKISDVKLMCELFEFSCLRSLTIVNCVEETPGILMASIAPHLRDLQSLRCEWKRSIDYNYETLHFLTSLRGSCPLMDSISLKLKIGTYQDCGQVLAQILSRCSPRVRSLSVEVKGAYYSFLGVSQSMRQLCQLKLLEFLHLLLTEPQIPPVMRIFRHLTHLKRVSIAVPPSKGKHKVAAPVAGGSSLICDDMINYHLSCGWDWFASRKSQFYNYSNDIVHIQPGVQWVRFNSERDYTFTQSNGKMKDVCI